MSAPSPPRPARPRRQATDTRALALAAQLYSAGGASNHPRPADALSSDDDGELVVLARSAAPFPPSAGPSQAAGPSTKPPALAPARKKPGPKPGFKRVKQEPSAGAAPPSKTAPAPTAAAAGPKRRKIEDALGLTIISALEFPLDDDEQPEQQQPAAGGSQRSASAKPANGAAGPLRDGSALPTSGSGPPTTKDGKEHPLQAFLANPAVALLKDPPKDTVRPPAFDLRSVKTASARVPPPRTRPRPFNLTEAPTFYPTADEFANALAYVRQISAQGAAAFGICKIVPPQGWQMPFVMDTDTFKFKTRLMRLNSIEAKSRAKLNFLEQLSMFHAQQGNPRLTVPVIDRRELDLWALRKEVAARGGAEAVSLSRGWAAVCRTVGLAPAFAQSVRSTYARVVGPYDDYAARARNTLARMSPRKKAPPPPPPAPKADAAPPPVGGWPKRRRRSSSLSTLPAESPVKPTTTTAVAGVADDESPAKARRRLADAAARMFVDGDSDLTDTDEEAVRMVAEPARPGPGAAAANGKRRRASTTSLSSVDEAVVEHADEDVCEVCQKGDRPTKMLLCDGCDLGFHIFCLDPPLDDIPENDTWYCPSCLIGNGAEFGFDEGDEHTLASFQRRDRAFGDYWWAMHPPKPKAASKPARAFYGEDSDDDSGGDGASDGGEADGVVPPNGVERTVGDVVVSEHDVEAEFWRLVDSKTETVEVEYGADVHSTIHGSAAPTLETHPLDPYAVDQWNLNNLSILPDSLLRYVKTQISGCTVPWIYVGHLFSAFCWHNEDHHTHSINHMHWGETKTWYGVPGEDAEKFEEALRAEAPDLFEQDPALLFQLVTLMNPGRLRKAGVRVYALDQRANEIVITFPKAFHAGFNHGLNYNEAVNFAMRDWLPEDLNCVRKYQEHSKAPVFSHDELLVSIAQNSPTIDTALWLTASFDEMVAREREARADARAGPLPPAEVLQPTDLPEEQYQCAECKVFTYLSQVVCSGCSTVLCHSHSSNACACAPGVARTLRVRYADGELEALRAKIAENAALPTRWRDKLSKVLQTGAAPSLKSLRALVGEAEQIEKMTALPELDPLRAFVGRCNEIVHEAVTLLTRKHKSRKGRISGFEGEDGEDRTLDGVREVLHQADRLGFEASEVAQLQHVLAQALSFAKEADELLESDNADEQSLAKVEALYATGSSLGLNLPQCLALEKIIKRKRWLHDLDEVDEGSLDLADIESYLDLARRNDVSADHPFVKVLEERKARGSAWKLAAEALLSPTAKITLQQLQECVDDADGASVDNAVLHRIKQLRHKAHDALRQGKALLDAVKNGHGLHQPDLLGEVERFQRRIQGIKGVCNVQMAEVAELAEFTHDLSDELGRLREMLGTDEPVEVLEDLLVAVRQRTHPADDQPSAAPLAGLRVSASPAPSSPAFADSPAPGSSSSRPLQTFSCVCRLPEEEGPSLQCIKCHATYHGACLGVPLKSVKAFKRYVCPVCDPKKLEAWAEGDRIPFVDLIESRARLENLGFALPVLEPLGTLIAQHQHLVDLIDAQLARPRPLDPAVVLHLLRKMEQTPIAPLAPGQGQEGARDLRALLLDAGGLKKRVRKQNPRWQIVGAAPTKNPAVVNCFCGTQPPADAQITALCYNPKCSQLYHASCLLVPAPPTSYDPAGPPPPAAPPSTEQRSFKCPICCIKQGTRYQFAELRLQMQEDLGTARFVEYKASLTSVVENRRVTLAPPESASITLIATGFTPGVPGDPKPTAAASPAAPVAGPSHHSHPVAANPSAFPQHFRPPPPPLAAYAAPYGSHAPRTIYDSAPAPAPIQYRSLPPDAPAARPAPPPPPLPAAAIPQLEAPSAHLPPFHPSP